MTFHYWCLIAAALLPYGAVVVAKYNRDYDNRQPRLWAQSLAGYGARAYAAQQNGFEAFPIFAAAVLVADISRVPPASIGVLAAGFVGARILYTIAYLANRSNIRSMLWFAGLILTMTIFTSPLWAGGVRP